MTDWSSTDLEKIGAAEELSLQSERADGSLRDPVTIWVVRVSDHLYVRSVKGTQGPWYRGTTSHHQGRVDAGGVRRKVSFRQAHQREYADVDAAYNDKYGRYASIVPNLLTDEARTSTLRLDPS